MQPVWASGRVDTVLGWVEWLEDKPWVEHYSAVAVHGALIFALAGKPGGAERWAEAAERTWSPGPLPDGNTMEGSLAYLRALLCRRGLDEMRGDAQIAWEGLSRQAHIERPCFKSKVCRTWSKVPPDGLSRSSPRL